MSEAKKKKKRGTAKKICITLLCLIILAVLGLSIAGNVVLYKKISNYPGDGEPPFDSGNVVVTPNDPATGISLLSIDSTELLVSEDESADFLVTVTPDVDAAVKLNWSIYFTNPAAQWASGKYVTEYASVVPTRDGALTANIKVNQAFGEQITVKASVRNDEDVFVTCTVDYVCKYVVQGFEAQTVESEYNEVAATITPKLVKSIGTIEEEIEEHISMKCSSNLALFLTEATGRKDISATMPAYKETGTNELTPMAFGIVPQSDYDDEFCVSFTSLSGPRYRLHMERLFYMTSESAKTLAEFESSYELWRSALKMEDLNKSFNSYLQRSHSDPDAGAKYGLRYIGAIIGISAHIIDAAFIVTYTLNSEHNDVTYIKQVPFVFIDIPATVGSLTIDPPSIIV